jgi:hypothetical protein
MSYEHTAQLDPEDCLRLLALASNQASADLAMTVISRNNQVDGESSRSFNNHPRLDIEGFYNGFAYQSSSQRGGRGIASSLLFVLRQCDAATASLSSILVSRDQDVTVRISVYRAGGDSGHALEPSLEFEATGAMLTQQTFFTGHPSGKPAEIVAFAYRRFEIRSAPQDGAGQRGAVRTCSFDNAAGA